MTVSELTTRVDVLELAEWMAYARLQADPKAFNTADENWMAILGGRPRG